MPGTAKDGGNDQARSADIASASASAEVARLRSDLERLAVDAARAGDDRALLHATALGLCRACESQISMCERLADALADARSQVGASLESLTGLTATVATSRPGRSPESRGREPPAPERAAERPRRRLRRLLGAGLREEMGEAPSPPAGWTEPQTPEDASLVVYCLGSLRAYQRGDLVTEWNGQKAQLLLRHLLVEHGRRMPREFLAELLWPNAHAEASRRNLHQAVYALRQTLRRREPAIKYIVSRDESYFLNPEAVVWTDFIELERRSEAARRLARDGDADGCVRELERAEALYSGDLFEDRLYDDRFRLLREHTRSVHLDVVAQLSDRYLDAGRHPEAVTLNQKALVLDPYDEQAHRRIIEAYVAQGQRGMALRQYEACRAVLADELGLEPSDELQRLRYRLAQ